LQIKWDYKNVEQDKGKFVPVPVGSELIENKFFVTGIGFASKISAAVVNYRSNSRG
jgi:hypothetical protein